MSKKKLSIGSWAYNFNQEKPTTDFHQVLHTLQDRGLVHARMGSVMEASIRRLAQVVSAIPPSWWL